MPRWPEDSRRRLVDAALVLFDKDGYTATTVDDIAARAGVTARTFFRYFPDKDEVLFADDDELLPLMLDTIATSTGPVSAGVLMDQVLVGLAQTIEPARVSLRRRQQIIDSELSLTGRELAKQARWQKEIAAALVSRGFEATASAVLSSIGFALFRSQMLEWLEAEDGVSLADRVKRALPKVRTVLDESTNR
ncbi:TetR family transcriptional regulator [Arthrobacter sp. CAN_A1]|uniref:TetR family transcriptional regulator n=1 Tax=Arthrobacter sp. CAN_A1 TaxID=2787717 RepID=UPI0018CB47B9